MIRWETYDGIGRTVRNGLNFTERGFGVRGAVGVSDRANTAIAHMAPGTVDWDDLFGRRGVRWLHTGGIYAALSENAAAVAEEAMSAAQRHGTVVSFDLNYRPSLWAGIGGPKFARDVNTRLASHVDVMIGNEEDFTASLGFDVDDVDENLRELPMDSFAAMVGTVAEKMPWFKVIATTMRGVHSANDNDWQAIAWSTQTGVLQSTARDHLAIYDRVGGGDGFASGLVYGLLQGEDLQQCLELGAAHGALAMTTPGDTSMAARDEVVALAGGGTARVRR